MPRVIIIGDDPLVTLTKAQRKAVFAVFKRARHTRLTPFKDEDGRCSSADYRKFRGSVVKEFSSDTHVMVHWCGMWLNIEKDGRTYPAKL